MRSRRTRLAAALALTGALAVLPGCATGGGGTGGDTITISYEVDGATQSKTFSPGDVTCHDFGAQALNFPEKPFNSLSITQGSTDDVSAWVYDGQLIYFEGENLAVSQISADDVTEYVVSGASGRVAVTELDAASDDQQPDVEAAIANAEWVDGTIDLQVRCAE